MDLFNGVIGVGIRHMAAKFKDPTQQEMVFDFVAPSSPFAATRR